MTNPVDSTMDLASEYRAGTRRTTCPKCLGGATGELSFSVYQRDDGRTAGTCWRAACKYFTIDMVLSWATSYEPKAFVPTPLRQAYRLKEFGLFGERVLVDDPTVTVWLLRDLAGNRTGAITRDAEKRIRTFKEVDRPVYYTNGLRVYGTLWIFEDPRSAAMCAEPAVALLGTSISATLMDDIKASKGPKGLTVFVALDPGAEEAASEVHKRLRDGGIEAVFVPMAKDFKDMTPEERAELLETYS